jgi:GntR family galactonate operon transcriptional repressor
LLTENSEPAASSDMVFNTVETLGRRIVRGDVAPGATLPVEQAICDELGVSRNVVREAVKTLAGKNLIRSARRAGTIVEPQESWNLLDPQVITWMLEERPTRETVLNALSELRAIIEPEAAALAAQRASTEQTLKLFQIYEQMKLHARDPERAVEFDVAFHRAVLEATGNMLLRTFSHGFGMLLGANFNLSIQVNNAFIRNLEDHRLIAEAIRDRDPEKARAVSRALLAKNEADIREMRASRDSGLVAEGEHDAG